MNNPLRRAALASAVLAALGIASTPCDGGRTNFTLGSLQACRPHVVDQSLVKLRDGVRATQRAAGREGVGARKLETERFGKGELMKLPAVMSIADAVRALRSHPTVEYAESNGIYQHADAANDRNYTNRSLWGMCGDPTSPANPYGSQAGEV